MDKFKCKYTQNHSFPLNSLVPNLPLSLLTYIKMVIFKGHITGIQSQSMHNISCSLDNTALVYENSGNVRDPLCFLIHLYITMKQNTYNVAQNENNPNIMHIAENKVPLYSSLFTRLRNLILNLIIHQLKGNLCIEMLLDPGNESILYQLLNNRTINNTSVKAQSNNYIKLFYPYWLNIEAYLSSTGCIPVEYMDEVINKYIYNYADITTFHEYIYRLFAFDILNRDKISIPHTSNSLVSKLWCKTLMNPFTHPDDDNLHFVLFLKLNMHSILKQAEMSSTYTDNYLLCKAFQEVVAILGFTEHCEYSLYNKQSLYCHLIDICSFIKSNLLVLQLLCSAKELETHNLARHNGLCFPYDLNTTLNITSNIVPLSVKIEIIQSLLNRHSDNTEVVMRDTLRDICSKWEKYMKITSSLQLLLPDKFKGINFQKLSQDEILRCISLLQGSDPLMHEPGSYSTWLFKMHRFSQLLPGLLPLGKPKFHRGSTGRYSYCNIISPL